MIKKIGYINYVQYREFQKYNNYTKMQETKEMASFFLNTVTGDKDNKVRHSFGCVTYSSDVIYSLRTKHKTEKDSYKWCVFISDISNKEYNGTRQAQYTVAGVSFLPPDNNQQNNQNGYNQQNNQNGSSQSNGQANYSQQNSQPDEQVYNQPPHEQHASDAEHDDIPF